MDLRPLTSSEERDSQEPSRAAWHGNLTLWWIIGLFTSAAFFCPSGKPIQVAEQTKPFGPCILLHLAGSAGLSFVCLANIFHTPSHGPGYCVFHRWLGRLGLCCSAVGVVFGLLTAWWERFSMDGLGLFIGLTIVSVLQTNCSIKGYLAIRRAKADPDNFAKHVREHKGNMFGLWASCMGPAFFRIPLMLGFDQSSPLMFLGLIPAIAWASGAARAHDKEAWL